MNVPKDKARKMTEDSKSRVMRLTQQLEQQRKKMQVVKEFAVRDAGNGDDRLLWLLHEEGAITEQEAGGWLKYRQHPALQLTDKYEHGSLKLK